jgi:hypothetical protein
MTRLRQGSGAAGRLRQGSGAAGVINALGGGLMRVLLSPLVVAAAMVAMLLAAAPFALIVGNELQTALSNQQPVSLDAGEIDPEWWFEYRQHAEGLTATFTPAIIGGRGSCWRPTRWRSSCGRFCGARRSSGSRMARRDSGSSAPARARSRASSRSAWPARRS